MQLETPIFLAVAAPVASKVSITRFFVENRDEEWEGGGRRLLQNTLFLETEFMDKR